MNLIIVINNMMSRCSLDDFLSKTFQPLMKLSYTRLIIVDDSGDLTDDQIKDYYGKISDLSHFNYERDLIANKKNENLLSSRFKVFELLDEYNLRDTWIRYLDSGDTPMNSELFRDDFESRLESNPDWIVFPQITEGKDFYYSCLGDTTNNVKITTSILMNLLSSTMWTKVFNADILQNVMIEIKMLNGGKIPNLFHMEDYLISSIYAKYVKNLKSLKIPYIKYDITSGESRSRIVDKPYLDKVYNDSNTVSKTIHESYINYESYPQVNATALTKFKIIPYLDRFRLQ